MKIGVVLPTRGLVFTEVEMALERNLRGLNHQIYRSSNLKIPDCENELVDKALLDGSDYILFVEEDTVMPEGGLKDMVMTDADIVAIDYSVAGWSCITRDKLTQEILWCGLGCTLVKSGTFKYLPKPYFRSDKQLLLNNWPQSQWVQAPRDAYGGQDIYFCTQAREFGFLIKQAPGECRHLRLEDLGRREINSGLHKIVDKEPISKYQTL